jgi:Fe-S-cluster containining protein
LSTGGRAAALLREERALTTDGYDCQACGACCLSCHGDRGGYVALTAAEAEAAGRLGLPVVGWGEGALLGTVPHAGRGGGRACAAFAGTVGGRCACSVYAERPAACRLFATGSLACRLARHAAGLGALPEEVRAYLEAALGRG